ncbi:hypothetical protein [Reyranella sp.]|uniref:hypothetical protein n=1 Tax=Reyranella sp. TaxID=1929291 RepID=UPI0025E6469D|nr:hypothetical protein [Reyranella sp.]
MFEYAVRDPGGTTTRAGGKLTVAQYFESLRKEVGTRLLATANCRTGELQFHYGTRPPRKVKFPLPPGTDESCASGMPPLIEQFRLLCPTSASKAEQTPPPPSSSAAGAPQSSSSGVLPVPVSPQAPRENSTIVAPDSLLSFRDLGDIQALERSRITETANPSVPIEVLVLVAAERFKVVLGCTNVGSRPDEARPSVYLAGLPDGPAKFRWAILWGATGKRELFGDEIQGQTVKTSAGALMKLELSEAQRAELSVIVGGYRSDSDGFYVVWRNANESVGFKLNPLHAKVRQEYFNMIMSCSPSAATAMAAAKEKQQREAMLAEIVNNACPCRGWFQMAARLGFSIPAADKNAIDEASQEANRIRSGPDDRNRAWREDGWASDCSALIENLKRQYGSEPSVVKPRAESCQAIARHWRTLKKQ